MYLYRSSSRCLPVCGNVGNVAIEEPRRLRPGETVTLTGDLVDGVRDDGASIRTSLTRTDTGPGACEVMLVREVQVARY